MDLDLLRERIIYYNIVEEGGAKIVKPSGKRFYLLYEIPQYGGNPNFVKKCKTLKEAKSIADKWT